MIIESISIQHFGNITDLSLSFCDGVNILVGANEAGKSTVAAFIRYMLYGFGTQNSTGDLPEREKRVSWQSKTAEGSMDIRLADGRRLRLWRRTEAVDGGGRVGYREESRFIDLADGSVTRFRSLPGEEFFTVPEQVYLNTAFFGELSSRINESETAQAMENLLFSGDERVSSLRALKTMKEARNSLSHPSGTGGAIYELAAQTEATRMRLTQAVRKAAQIHRTETELHRLSVKIASAEAERDRLSEVVTDYRGYLTICSFEKLHEIESAYTALKAEREALRHTHEANGFLPDEAYLASLQTAERVCSIAHKNYLQTKEKLASVQAETEIPEEDEILLSKADAAGGADHVRREYYRLEHEAGRGRFLAFSFLALFALFLGLGAFLFRPFALTPVTAFWGVLALACAAFSVVFFRNRQKALGKMHALYAAFGVPTGQALLLSMSAAENTCRTLKERRESIVRAEENAEISQRNFEQLRHELEAIAARWGKEPDFSLSAGSVSLICEEARLYLDEEKRLAEELAEVRGRMMALREELAGKSEVAIRSEVPPSRREKLKTINYKTIEEGLAYYTSTCENFYAQYKCLLDELDEHRKASESTALLRTELAAMEERLATLRRRYRAYLIASDAIENAADRLRAEISPRLSHYAGNLLSIATEGRYEGLDVTNRLSMSYREDGVVRPLSAMSGSVTEIAYVSLRLALIDMLYEEMPPLCFDESLAHQDDSRTANIIRLLGTVAKAGMQSILFTCRHREAEIAVASEENTRCLYLDSERSNQ